MQEGKASCERPAAVVAAMESAETGAREEPKKEAKGMTIMVGRKAPDFTAPAYHKGSFTPVSLSSFLGKWVVVCFYPGDFTFV
jgi:peroxiredoxin (alkyl hydroperoxide reductase subunit C)